MPASPVATTPRKAARPTGTPSRGVSRGRSKSSAGSCSLISLRVRPGRAGGCELGRNSECARRPGSAVGRRPGAAALPTVPAIDLDPGAPALLLAVAERLPGVVTCDAVDVARVRIACEVHDAASEADVSAPVAVLEHRERDARVVLQVDQSRAR